MPGLLDDLKGLLSAEEFAKLQGNAALNTKLSKASELHDWYVGEEGAPDPTQQPVQQQQQNRTPPPTNAFSDIQAIERMLDSKLAKLDERIDSRFSTLAEQRGNELVNNAVNLALQRSDELNRVYMRHQADFNEAFDSTAFAEFNSKPENSVMDKDGKRLGSKFRSVTEAYDSFTAEKREAKKLAAAKAEGVAEGKAASSGRNLPGTTPGPMNSNIKFFTQRGRTDANGNPDSRSGRAATALDNLMAKREAQSA